MTADEQMPRVAISAFYGLWDLRQVTAPLWASSNPQPEYESPTSSKGLASDFLNILRPIEGKVIRVEIVR